MSRNCIFLSGFYNALQQLNIFLFAPKGTFPLTPVSCQLWLLMGAMSPLWKVLEQSRATIYTRSNRRWWTCMDLSVVSNWKKTRFGLWPLFFKGRFCDERNLITSHALIRILHARNYCVHLYSFCQQRDYRTH